MNIARKIFWFLFITILFVPGIIAHRTDRNPQVASVPVSVGDVADVSGDYSAPDNTTLINVDASGGNKTITLPDAATVPNIQYTVVKIDTSANVVIVQAVGGDTICGSIAYGLSKQYDTLKATSDGTNYVTSVPMEENVDIRLFGVVGDGVTDARAGIVLAAVQAAGNNLRFPAGTYRVADDLTLDENVIMDDGAMFSIDNTKTLTFSGSFSAPDSQAFTGAGTPAFSAGSVEKVNIQWFNDGSSDVTPFVDAAMDAGPGLTTYIPDGSWTVETDLTTDESVEIGDNAVLTVDPGITLDFDGATLIYVRHGQHFTVSSGTIIFRDSTGVDAILPAWFGASPDSVDNAAAFQDAVDSGAEITRVKIPAGLYNMLTDVDTAGMILDMPPGTKIDIGPGATLTVGSGGLEAGLYQIFQGSGDVVFDEDAVEHVLPQWWGAVGDDSTDCHAAFEAAIAAMGNVGKMVIPPGIYQISSPIDQFPYNWSVIYTGGYLIEGSGVANTVIKYTGVSGYAIRLFNDDLNTEATQKTVGHVTLRDFRIQAPNTGSAGGGGIDMPGTLRCNLENIVLDDIDATYGTAIRLTRRPYIATEDSFTTTPPTGTDRVFTDSGGLSDAFAVAYTTPANLGGYLKSVTVRLAKTGAPAGTLTATLYSDAAGPNAIIPGIDGTGVSATVSCNSLNSGADGADQTFAFDWNERAAPVASTKYWIVFNTSGYTYVPGVDEVRLRVEAAAGAANTFATYDGGGVSWSTSADGANYVVTIGRTHANMNMARGIEILNNDGTDTATGIDIQDDSQLHLMASRIFGKTFLKAESRPELYVSNCTLEGQSATAKPIDFAGTVTGRAIFEECYFEGGAAAYPHDVGGLFRVAFLGCRIGGFLEWDAGTQVDVLGCQGPIYMTDDPEMQPNYNRKYQIYTPNRADGTRSVVLGGTATTAADANALTGTTWSLPANIDKVQLFLAANAEHDYTRPPRGTYLFTIYALATGGANQLRLRVFETNAAGSRYLDETYDLSTSYEPYYAIVPHTNYGKGLYFTAWAAGVNGVKISHMELRYIGPDLPHQRDIVAFNTEAGDADGDRLSRVVFQGIQSGDEQASLASITVSHHGAADDEKAQLDLFVNDGDDAHRPSKGVSIISDGGVFMLDLKSGATQGAAGAAAGELWHDTDDDTIKLGT